MAPPSHVPADHHPSALPGQNIYTDPSYENLFPSLDQYGVSSWTPSQQNIHHPPLGQQGQGQSAAASPWQHSFTPSPYGQSYAPNNNAYQTASPYQYGHFAQNNSPGPMASYGQAPAVDPNLVDHMSSMRQQQQSPYQTTMRNSTPNGQTRTVAPQALQQGTPSLPHAQNAASPFQIPKSTTEMFSQPATPSNAMQPVSTVTYEMSKGKPSGGFSILDTSALAKANRIVPLNNLVSFGLQPLSLNANRTILPQYNPRQSLNDLKKAGTKDKKVLDKLVKKATPKSHRPPTSLSRLSASSPSSLKREISDSESTTESSDEESDYSDEEDEPSPLPASRPEEPNDAVRYDVIKATWASRRYNMTTEKVRSALNDIWEVLSTIQKRWRIDSKAVMDAETQHKTNELPVLKSRVASGRDLLRVALKALLEYGHPDVLYQMGKNKPFLYLCYQFLANRFKMKDFDGKLSSVIYEVLAKCVGTLTSEALEETKLNKALISMKKSANEQNKKFIQQIFEGAETGSKKAKASSPPKDEAKDSSTVKRPTTQTAPRPVTDTAGAKKLKTAEPMIGATKKGLVTAPPSKTTAFTSATSQKRPGEKPAPVPAKARGTQVVNKPSSFFSTLNAASKKPAAPVASATKASVQPKASTVLTKKSTAAAVPAKKGFSFADTMDLLQPKEEPKVAPKAEKQLPPETPEEKAKRLRKESRRHLRVTFRPDASLVSIRYFHHDPDEELGHDENFVRDAGDIGGEGRMFKQHRDMQDDEEDDDPEVTYREWRDLTNVDFSEVDLEERKRNFEPYGGGLCQPICPDKEANQQREAATLTVFYSHPAEIPPTPREPLDVGQDETTPLAKEFGLPPEFVLNRVPKPAVAALPSDFSALFETFKQHSTGNVAVPPVSAPPPAFPLPPPPAGNPPDLAAIMGLLQNIQPAQSTTPMPAAPPPAPNVDLSSILASLTAANGAGATPYQAPQTAWPFPIPFPQQSQQQDYAAYQDQQQHGQNHSNGGTKRPHDDGNDNNYGSYKKQKGHRNGPLPHKVIPCKFFKKGQCAKGDACTFIHEQ